MQKLGIFLFICILNTVCFGLSSGPIELISVENLVEVSVDGGKKWQSAKTGDRFEYGYRVRTGEFSRAALQYPSGNVIRLGEFSRITLSKGKESEDNKNDKSIAIELKEGALYFFSRTKDSESEMVTPTVNAAIRGTEFELRVTTPDLKTELSLFEGKVDLTNDAGTLALQSGERAAVKLNQAPKRLPAIEASSYMQWYLYYPGVLDTRELGLDTNYSDSIAAYEKGDLLGALERLPKESASNQQTTARIYETAVILASGQIDAAKMRLSGLQHPDADALHELILAVTGNPLTELQSPETATGWLVRSYTYQALGDLENARSAAEESLKLYPEFGYAAARLSRLHFGFGEIDKMDATLEQASIHNAANTEVYLLHGFERAANGKMDAANDFFLKAIDLAPNYPEAYLGRGLVAFNEGTKEDGLKYLVAAAALQPNNSLLRSYLAKGFAENESVPLPFFQNQSNAFEGKALNELELAKELDPNDPTPWLYSALIKRDELRYNEALRDLEESIRLNDNRSLFRSRSLLDGDVAVRRSNLADIYEEAGLPTQALAEAGKAIHNDYTSFAAHDFLARVYREQFDETNINQRNNTALANEFFLRNIFAPIGSGIASQKISNQEYSSLFNEQGVSGTVEASYDSRERYTAAGLFTYQGSNYEVAVEFEYEDWDDFYLNDDFESTTTQLHFRYQPTAQDRFYSLLNWSESEQGDLRSLPDPDAVNSPIQDFTVNGGRTTFTPSFGSNLNVNTVYGRDAEQRFEEEQQPLFFNTYARDWNDRHTSLFLYGWSETKQTFEDPLIKVSGSNPSVTPPAQKIYDASIDIEQDYDLHTFEFQHIWKGDRNQLILGSRLQVGEIEDDTNLLAAVNSLVPFLTPLALDTAGTSKDTSDLERFALYSQFTQELSSNFSIIAGLKFESIDYPDGLGGIPRLSEDEDETQLSPQAGFIWEIDDTWLLRGAYARSMSGYSIEDQLRLEPSNIAGLTTAYSSIIPNQIVSIMPAGTIDTFSLALTGKINDATFLSIDGGFSTFDGDRTLGQFEETIPNGQIANTDGDVIASKVDQNVDYDEINFSTRIDHLLNRRTSIGASFSWQYAQIDERLKSDLGINSTSPYLDDTDAHLYIAALYGRFQHPTGFFAQTDLQYWYQENGSIDPDIDNESAPNLNLSFGYRLRKQKGEVRLSVLNLTDEEYELNPLSNYNLPPQERTFLIETRFNF